jgi:hypothetical protein
MTSKILRTAVAIAVVLTAWTVGRLQGQALDADRYLITIDAPSGTTTLACQKGCNWKTGEFSCGAARCGYTFNQDGFARR